MSSFLAKEHQIKGKNVVITGGVKNLGGATAKELAKFGANLFLHYHSSPDDTELKKFVSELESHGIKVKLYQADLDGAQDLAKLFSEAKSAFPNGIDVAINTVGRVLKKPLVTISEKEFDGMDNTNNKIAFFFIQEAAKSLNKGGKIVSLVTSLLAAYTPLYSTYQGTKAPVEYYTKSASKELQDREISVNCVAPGPMDTPFLYPQESDDSVEYLKSVGTGSRLTKITDIVPIIRFLVTEGVWITGQTIYASGGFTAH